MKVIIPMTGYGSRFVAAGYEALKPFIQVEGKPILEWIVRGMYPGEEDFVFVCRQEHLDQRPEMAGMLRAIAPKGQIFAIDDWEKKGPVYDVLLARDMIGDEEPVIVNYCDFFMYWDYEAFKKDVAAQGCDGAVPCYTGFHPHLLIEDNVYASCRTDAQDNLLEIREKYSFEKDKQKARHSPGLYYFRTGKIMKQYFQEFIEAGDTIRGEYYASLPYNLMVRDGLRVWIPANVEQFCQWGTPEDLADFCFWVSMIKERTKA